MATVVAVVLLLAAGVAYRTFASAWQMSPDAHIELPVPLREIPFQVGTWVGEDQELEEGIQAYMKTHFADDYISRRYVNTSQRLVADAYVVYCSTRPAGILGHNPRVCYPGNGYIWDATEPSQFTTVSGRVIDCLIHRLHKPAPAYFQIYVLNFYVLNGRVTLREKEFSGWSARKLNLANDYGRYVAQVQISSTSEEAIEVLASEMGDIVLSFLPDENGEVAAARAGAAPIPVGGAAENGL